MEQRKPIDNGIYSGIYIIYITHVKFNDCDWDYLSWLGWIMNNYDWLALETSWNPAALSSNYALVINILLLELLSMSCDGEVWTLGRTQPMDIPSVGHDSHGIASMAAEIHQYCFEYQESFSERALHSTCESWFFTCGLNVLLSKIIIISKSLCLGGFINIAAHYTTSWEPKCPLICSTASLRTQTVQTAGMASMGQNSGRQWIEKMAMATQNRGPMDLLNLINKPCGDLT